MTSRGVAEALSAYPGLRVGGATEVTSPAETLTKASGGATMLVIGTRGRGPVLGAMLGSVAFEVAANVRCPVIVVKADNAPGDPGRPVLAPGRVVVGTDGSSGAADAVSFAADHAASVSATLQILTCTGEHTVDGIPEAQLRVVAWQIADAARDRLNRTHPGLAVTNRVEDGPADQALVDASVAADLVVVGSRGQGAYRGLLLGSVSHAVIHGAHCPVAVIGPSQRPRSDVAAGPGLAPGTPAGAGLSPPLDLVETWGLGSFPASDPPANW